MSIREGSCECREPFDQHLAAHDRVDRDVEQKPREHRGDRRRAFGVRIRQPVVQRREPDLRPVADERKTNARPSTVGSSCPFTAFRCVHSSAVTPFGAEHLLGGEVQEDRAEERLGDADAAQDEVLPAGLQARRRPVQRHQQHGREGCRLHRDPQKPHVVGRERDQHRRHEELIHAVVEAQSRRG